MLRNATIDLPAMGIRAVTALQRVWLWPALVIAVFAGITFWPGPLSIKAHDVLHGLCAQQPGHSIVIGGQMLPFDARMTGIYGGTFVTYLWLAVAGRLRRQRDPAHWVFGLCVVLIAAMGIDGFNSLFADAGLWHPYETTNFLRLVTGAGAGVAIALILGWLFATSVWSSGIRGAVVDAPRDLLPVLAGCVAYIAIVSTRAGWLYQPATYVLVLSAWLTLSLLTLVILILASRRDRTLGQLAALHVSGALALAGGLLLMAALAGGRFWLEHRLGIPTSM